MISFQPMTTPPMTQLHSLILRFLLLPALAVALPLSLHAASPLENAETALQTGDLVTAETLLTPLDTATETDPTTLRLLSRLRLAQKRTKEAVALAERVTAAHPDQAAGFARLGHAYSQRIAEVTFMQQAMLSGKLRRAFERCVELDPKNLDGLIGLTRYFSNAPEIAGGSIVKAREYARQVAAVHPFLGAIELGRLAEKEKQPEAALGHYEPARQLKPKHAGVLAACGRLLAQLGRKDEARQRFTAALALQPGHAGANKGLENLDKAATAPAPAP